MEYEVGLCENCGFPAQSPYNYCKSCRSCGIGIEDDDRALHAEALYKLDKVSKELELYREFYLARKAYDEYKLGDGLMASKTQRLIEAADAIKEYESK